MSNKATITEKAERLDEKAGDLWAMLKTLSSFVEGCIGDPIEEENIPGLAYMLQLFTKKAEEIKDGADSLHTILAAAEQERGAA